MALKRPDTGQFVQDVQVNGLPMHAFEALRRGMSIGDSVRLVRDKGNLHDSLAVKVCYGDGLRQVGWVPMAVNRKIASLLDNGVPLEAKILRVGPAELAIRVCTATAEPVKPVSYRVSLHDPWIDPFCPGSKLGFRTTSERTSVTLVGPNGEDLGWFRKSELPDGALSGLIDGTLHLVVRPLGLYIEDVASWPGRRENGSLRPLEDRDRPLPADGPAVWGSVAGSLAPTEANLTTATTTEKGNTVSLSSKTTNLINNNKSAATQAGYLEAGRIANNQVVKLSSKALPMMVRGYADTPIGKLVIANVAQMAAAQLRPNDPTLAKLTTAMTVAAYQEVIQTVDIEGWLDELMSSPAIKRAVDKMGAADAAAE